MSRARSRRLYWNPPGDTDVAGYYVYAGPQSAANFLSEVDAGNVQPFADVTDVEKVIGPGDLADGDYQFAVCAYDQAGNISDPYQHPAWVNVPLDITPPSPPSGGGIEFV